MYLLKNARSIYEMYMYIYVLTMFFGIEKLVRI